MRNLLLFFLLFIQFHGILADESIPPKQVHSALNLVSHENKTFLAFSFKNEPHWHTYWANPGDAGLPLKFQFLKGPNKDQEFSLQSLIFPAPERFIEKGDIWAYGHENEYSYFYEVDLNKIPSDFLVKIGWLVCKHICIPGAREFHVLVKNNSIIVKEAPEVMVSETKLVERLQNLPQKVSIPEDLDINLVKIEDKKLILYYSLMGENFSHKNKLQQNNLLYPYPHELFGFKHEILKQDKKGNIYGKIIAEWEGDYNEPPYSFPVDGKFKSKTTLSFIFTSPIDGKSYHIEKEFSDFALMGHEKFEQLFTLLTTFDHTSNNDTAINSKIEANQTESSLLYFLLLAFIGGFILNFMPCVLPVISIKLFGLINQRAENKSRIFKHNIYYSLGVFFTFFVLASIVTLLKNGGASVGWGFQLQSPYFVLIMIGVLFVFSLNLFGLFEFNTPGGRTLGNVALKEGFAGDFTNGIIATILSTPCTAPFLGTALSFAFTSSTLTFYLIFFSVALGLSFPFLITAFFPSTIKLLPKPGMWMVHLKKFMALSLILTVIWLIDVFAALTDPSVIIYLLTALTFLFFTFYWKHLLPKRIALTILSFLLFSFVTYHLIHKSLEVSNLTSTDQNSKNSEMISIKTGLNWEPWSEEKMNELKDKKEKVFIEFTAKWCFNCKVNERLVLHTDAFKNLVQNKNIKLLLADWTKRDPIMGKWLQDHGSAGVPAYFVIKENGEMLALGETISIDKIENSFN